ncbi:MAG: leucine-rich repeat domain-containing protein, partial [Brotaphodocola sp.]
MKTKRLAIRQLLAKILIVSMISNMTLMTSLANVMDGHAVVYEGSSEISTPSDSDVDTDISSEDTNKTLATESNATNSNAEKVCICEYICENEEDAAYWNCPVCKEDYTECTGDLERSIAVSVEYILNGGENAPENPNEWCEDDGEVLLSPPTKEGYLFIGWFTENTEDSVCVTELNENLDSSGGVITLYAIWEQEMTASTIDMVLENPSYLDLVLNADGNVALTWGTVENADGYILVKQESGSSEMVEIDRVDAESAEYQEYIDTDTKADSEFYYGVQSFVYTDEGIMTADWYTMNRIKIMVPFDQIAFRNVFESAEGSVYVSWKPSYQASGYTLSRIEIASPSTAEAEVIGDFSGSDGSYHDYSVVIGVTYVYYLQPYYIDESGNRVFGETLTSNEVTVTNGEPLEVPEITKVTPVSDGSIRLEWNAVKGADHYIVERAVVNDGILSDVERSYCASSDIVVFHDTQTSAGVTYQYSVQSGKEIYDDRGYVIDVEYSDYSSPVTVTAQFTEETIYFYEENLKAALVSVCDTNEDGELSPSELENVTGLDLSDRGIQWLENFSYLPNLEVLDVSGNELTDLWELESNCPNLHTLYARDNQLEWPPSVNGVLMSVQIYNEDGTSRDIFSGNKITYSHLTGFLWNMNLSEDWLLLNACDTKTLIDQDFSYVAVEGIAVQLNWEEQYLATGYAIERSQDQMTWTTIKELSGRNNCCFNDYDIEDGQTYFYRIKAYQDTNSGRVYSGSREDGWEIKVSIDMSQIVNIPDENLLQLVCQQFGHEDIKKVTKSEMENLGYLYGANSGICNLTGLECAVNLNGLDLANNEITDITPLSGLGSISSLSLDNNKIQDISALTGLTNLTYLSLNNNDILEIPDFSNITSLKLYEDTNGTVAGDVPRCIFSGNRALNNKEVFAGHFAAELTDDWYALNMYDSTPVEIQDPILKRVLLENGIDLDGDGTIIQDELKQLKILRYKLDENADDSEKIRSLEGLQSAVNLRQILLPGNAITDLSPLQGQENLDVLNLNRNQISNLSPLSNISWINVLKLEENQISDLSPLKDVSICELYLDNNQITDLSPIIDNGSDLCRLSVNNNQLSSLPNFKGKGIYLDLFEYGQASESNWDEDIPLQMFHGNGFTWSYLWEVFSYLDPSEAWYRLNCDVEDVASIQQPLPSETTVNSGDTLVLEVGVNNPTEDSLIYSWTYKYEGQTNYAYALPDVTGNTLSLPVQDWMHRSIIRCRITSSSGYTVVTETLVTIEGMGELERIPIPDENLRTGLADNGVRVTADGYINLAQVAGITSLDLNGYGISSLAGIEYFTGLKKLKISSNNLTSIDEVGVLFNLQVLKANLNQITSISPLGGLDQLEVLELNGNMIKNIGVIATLNGLCELSLADNQISNVNPLRSFTKFVRLDLSGNKITNLSPLYECMTLGNFTVKNNPDLTVVDFYNNPDMEFYVQNEDGTSTPIEIFTGCSITKKTLYDVFSYALPDENDPWYTVNACAENDAIIIEKGDDVNADITVNSGDTVTLRVATDETDSNFEWKYKFLSESDFNHMFEESGPEISFMMDGTEGIRVKCITYDENWIQTGAAKVTIRIASQSDADGWVETENGWMFYRDGEAVKDELIHDSKGIWYLDEDGYMVTNKWVKHKGDYYYFGSDGNAYRNETFTVRTIDGKNYVFQEDGIMMYGWVNSTTNSMAASPSGWKYADYYFGDQEDGSMKTGWEEINVYDPWNAPETYADNWFHFKSEGQKRTKQLKMIGENNYYFDEYGCMWYSTSVEVDGVTYVLDENGHATQKVDVIFEITKQPENVVAGVNDTVIFSVEATGVENYQWQFSRDGGETWQTAGFSGNKTSEMTVELNATRIRYEFRCELTGTDGSKLYTDTVKAAEAFKITKQPINAEVADVNETVKFSVEASGVSSYQWQFSRDGETWQTAGFSGNKTSEMT